MLRQLRETFTAPQTVGTVTFGCADHRTQVKFRTGGRRTAELALAVLQHEHKACNQTYATIGWAKTLEQAEREGYVQVTPGVHQW